MITHLTYAQIVDKYHFDKHIWEGWEVRDFITKLDPTLDRLMEYGLTNFAEPLFKTKDEINTWVKNNLPYTTKALRYVTKYFVDKYNGMPIAEWSNPEGRTTLKLK